MVAFKALHLATLLTIFSLSFITNGSLLHGAYIVEFADTSSADQTNFHEQLENQGIDATPRLSLSHSLFNGASFVLPGSNSNRTHELERIQTLPMVKQLWPVHVHDLADYSVLSRGNIPAAEPAGPKEREADTENSTNSTQDTFSTHVMGGVDRLRELGYTGKGLFVAILDTGVDYTNAALGGGFGPGYKFAHGTDLVGDAYNGYNDPVPDDDPLDCDGHGSHVSGTVGANAVRPYPYNFTGVVPDATLGMYRVFGCNSSSADDVLISGLNMAFEAGADVISGSFGGDSGWNSSALDVVASRIVAAGTSVVIAAGNAGDTGLFDSQNPGEATGATSVGSVDNVVEATLLVPATYTTTDDKTGEVSFGYASGKYGDFGNASFPLFAVNPTIDIWGDGCTDDNVPSDTPDLSDYVVLVRRGGCKFDDKIETLGTYGAKRFLFYNIYVGEAQSPGDESMTIPVGGVSKDLGEKWVKLLSAGTNITINFTAKTDDIVYFEEPKNNVTAGFMSIFSSWGPPYSLDTKPELSAPGAYILSTYPVNKGSYAVISGTSMATPFAAGCHALVKQVRGNKTRAAEIQNLLVSTAKPLEWNDGNVTYPGQLAPVLQQGGGSIDVFAAAFTETILSASKLNFNDTAHFVKQNSFSIRNDGKNTVTYVLGNSGTPTVLALEKGSRNPSYFQFLEFIQSFATIEFTPDKVTIEAGDEVEILVELTPPTGLDAARLPVYSGFVTVNGTNGDSLTLPYSGVAGNMYDAGILDIEKGYPILTNSSNTNLTFSTYNSTNETTIPYFTIPHVNSSDLNENCSYPEVDFQLSMGSRLIRLDVIPVDINSTHPNVTEILGVKTLGSADGYPVYWVYRNDLFSGPWTGQLDDDSFVPEGTYKLLMRALKIFGDENKAEDYESYETGVLGIKYLPY